MNQFWLKILLMICLTGLVTSRLWAQGSSSNRRQDLYDQYYGVSHKIADTKPLTRITKVKTEHPQPESAPVRVVQDQPRQEVVTQVESVEAAAQPTSSVSARTRIRIGARGGLLMPVLLDNPRGYSAGTDFVGGVMMILGSGLVQFQPEINYSRTAVRSRALATIVTRSATDQVVVPLLARLSFGKVTGNQFYINAGPYSAYETSASLNGLKVPFERDEQRVSYGAAAGAGVAVRMGPGHIGLDVRGRYRLTNTDSSTDSRPTAVYTEATLSYVFPLGGR